MRYNPELRTFTTTEEQSKALGDLPHTKHIDFYDTSFTDWVWTHHEVISKMIDEYDKKGWADESEIYSELLERKIIIGAVI
jgi:hypothetical protein